MKNIVGDFLVSCWKNKTSVLIGITITSVVKITDMENYIYNKLDFLNSHEIISKTI